MSDAGAAMAGAGAVTLGMVPPLTLLIGAVLLFVWKRGVDTTVMLIGQSLVLAAAFASSLAAASMMGGRQSQGMIGVMAASNVVGMIGQLGFAGGLIGLAFRWRRQVRPEQTADGFSAAPSGVRGSLGAHTPRAAVEAATYARSVWCPAGQLCGDAL